MTLNRIDIIRERLADLERELAEVKRFGEDVFEDGEILTWGTRFGHESGTKYTFAALKAGGRWYLTGSIYGGRSYSWEDLVGFWRTSKVRSVRVVTATKRAF